MVAFYGSDLTVLVVEDNQHFRLLIRTVLRSLGIRRIEEAADGAGGRERIKGLMPDLVIVDWRMEPVNGIEFVRWLRKDAASPNPYVPIVMISGYAETGLMTEAREAGVNEFMAKPISARMLLSRVVGVLLRPRPFVRAPGYFGPDRRQRPAEHSGSDRRGLAPDFIGPGAPRERSAS